MLYLVSISIDVFYFSFRFLDAILQFNQEHCHYPDGENGDADKSAIFEILFKDSSLPRNTNHYDPYVQVSASISLVIHPKFEWNIYGPILNKILFMFHLSFFLVIEILNLK